MTKHKNVEKGIKQCEAIVKKWNDRRGHQCKKWARYSDFVGSQLKYFCTQHFDLEIGHTY